MVLIRMHYRKKETSRGRVRLWPMFYLETLCPGIGPDVTLTYQLRNVVPDHAHPYMAFSVKSESALDHRVKKLWIMKDYTVSIWDAGPKETTVSEVIWQLYDQVKILWLGRFQSNAGHNVVNSKTWWWQHRVLGMLRQWNMGFLA